MKSFFTFLLLYFCSLLGAQIPSYVPANGLVGYWPFTGNANDVSGSGYHGTVFGAQLATDRFNNAVCSYSFNGINNYILTPYQGILGSNARSVSFWAKTPEMNAVITGVAWGSNSSGNRFGCGFNYGGSGSTIGIANGAITYSTPASVYDNQWHHYVFQSAGSSLSQVQIYQDGVLLTQSVHSFSVNTLLNTIAGFNVQFGRVNYNAAPDYFKGQLDDIGIWNRTLTQCEILGLYHGEPQIIADGPTTFCSGGSVMLSTGMQGPYSWNIGANTQSIVVNTSGNYFVNISTGSCTISSNTVSVVVNPFPALTVISTSSLLCAGQTATLSASGASSYTWSNGASGNTNSVNPTVSTTYTLTGTLNNCSSTFVYTQNVSECTGIKVHQTTNNDPIVFPNPADRVITVRAGNSHPGFSIYDSQGRLIKPFINEQTADISDLKEGLYLVKTNDGQTSKFIKIR